MTEQVNNTEPADTQTADTPQSWSWEAIPEDYRNSPEIKGFEKNGAPAMAKSYMELLKTSSAKVKIPAPDAPLEEKQKFWQKIGVPEKTDGYSIQDPVLTEEDKSLGIAYSPGLVKDFVEKVAHKSGFTNAQVQAAVNYQMDLVREGMRQQAAEAKKMNDERWTKYKSEWGETKTNENIELAKRAFNEFAPPELKEMMTVDDVPNDPILVRMYSSIWRKVMPDSFVQGTQTSTTEKAPDYPKSPEMYRNKPEQKWFESRGYDYNSRTWSGKG